MWQVVKQIKHSKLGELGPKRNSAHLSVRKWRTWGTFESVITCISFHFFSVFLRTWSYSSRGVSVFWPFKQWSYCWSILFPPETSRKMKLDSRILATRSLILFAASIFYIQHIYLIEFSLVKNIITFVEIDWLFLFILSSFLWNFQSIFTLPTLNRECNIFV